MPLPEGFTDVIIDGKVLEDPYPYSEEYCVLWCLEKGAEIVGGMFLTIRPYGLDYAVRNYTNGFSAIVKAAVLPTASSSDALARAEELQTQIIEASKASTP